ncbi:hypothetical protein ACWIUD_10155 [Helicobacter sp. 23-1044]
MTKILLDSAFFTTFAESHKKSQNLAMTDKNTPLRHCEANRKIRRSNPQKN